MLFRTLIYEDATQNDMPTILQDLSSKSQGSEEGKEGKEEGKRRKTEKMLRRKTKVTLI